jgi:SAM-dependent methyltransferase
VPKGTLYDLGCGVGANLGVLEQFGPTVGVDSSAEAVAYCHERGQANVRQGDIGSLPELPAESGSVVMLADVIEHLDDEHACLRVAHRLLKPGGVLVVTVPAFMFLWSALDEIAHHRRRYTERDLRQVVSRHFTLEWSTYFNTLLFGSVLAGRLLEGLLRRDGTDQTRLPPPPVNEVLKRVFASEARWLGRVRFPFGVSVLCVARKAW